MRLHNWVRIDTSDVYRCTLCRQTTKSCTATCPGGAFSEKETKPPSVQMGNMCYRAAAPRKLVMEED